MVDAEMERYLDDLDRAIDAGDIGIVPNSVIRASDDPEGGLRLILEATGTTNFADAVRVATGRPHVGQERGDSPELRARVPRDVKEGVHRLAKRQHRTESDVVREAIARYLEDVDQGRKRA